MFLFIFSFLIVGNGLWWLWADNCARRLRRPLAWRLGIAAFMLLQFGFLALFVIAPVAARRSQTWAPRPLLAGVYVWHLLVLPLSFVALMLFMIGTTIARPFRRRTTSTPVPPNLAAADPAAPAPAPAPAPAGMTRRQLLTAAAITAPPLLTFGLTGRAIWQLGELRVRRFDVPVAHLPPNLERLTIAHVSDVHIGRFTRDKDLATIVELTNQLRADLVLFTGDLIDMSLADLPAGIDMIRRLDPRHGLAVIEGNHDLFESRAGFESRVRGAQLPLLIDESTTLIVRGEPVQLLGIRWGRAGAAPAAIRRPGDESIREAVDRVLAQRIPDALPILLAHHPHAFDTAAAAGIPLTLGGHTHGGQLMLTDHIGAGPAMFRYWSGLYRKTTANGAPTSLVVSNGCGNWFPLRIHAPAEIVHITLRRAAV